MSRDSEKGMVAFVQSHNNTERHAVPVDNTLVAVCIASHMQMHNSRHNRKNSEDFAVHVSGYTTITVIAGRTINIVQNGFSPGLESATSPWS